MSLCKKRERKIEKKTKRFVRQEQIKKKKGSSQMTEDKKIYKQQN